MLNGTTEQFQKFANDYNKMMMDSWSSWTKQTVQSDSFASASGAMMDWSLTTHKMMSELSGQMMESLDIPKRSDLARLSAQIQAVEIKLLAQEENQAEIRDLLMTVIQKMDTMAASAQAQAPAAAAPAQSSVVAPIEVAPEAPKATPKSNSAKGGKKR